MTDLEARLEGLGQTHLLLGLRRLTGAARDRLGARIEALPLEQLPAMLEQACAEPARAAPEPPACYPADPADARRPWDARRFAAHGEALLRKGAVAAFVVAGGQGTRLGHPGPKGTFPVTPVTEASLFAVFAAQLRAARARYGVAPPWYVMTSPLNHEATEAFFEAQGWFGLDPGGVVLFEQGVLPTVDLRGRVLLADPETPATHPDGHGGSLLALARSGALADMGRRGVAHLSYFQVDNPATRVLDPAFLGLHAAAPDSSAQMAAKVVVKGHPGERVGVFARVGGRLRVIEYSDLSAEAAEARRPDGGLVFDAGNVAVHAMSLAFLERVGGGLPLHRAEKRCDVFDPRTGAMVEAARPNAIKLERFVFDALAEARAPLLLEVDRVEAFAPVKNAEGADSPATSRALQVERAARWLERNGVVVPRDAAGRPDCLLEIRPETALDAAELAAADLPARIERGARLVL